MSAEVTWRGLAMGVAAIVCLAFAAWWCAVVAVGYGSSNPRFDQWVSADYLPSIFGFMAFAYLVGRLLSSRARPGLTVRSLVALAAMTGLCATAVPLVLKQIDRDDDGVLGLIALVCLGLAVWVAGRIGSPANTGRSPTGSGSNASRSARRL